MSFCDKVIEDWTVSDSWNMRQNSSAGEPVAMSSDQSQVSSSSENSAVPHDDLQNIKQKRVILEPNDALENGKSAFQITSVSELKPSHDESKLFADIITATDVTESALESSTEVKPADEQAYGNEAGNAHPAQPAAGCSRFRRVNEYLRGRWSVRDITETLRDSTEVDDSGSGVDAPTPPGSPTRGDHHVASDSRVPDVSKTFPLPRDTVRAPDGKGDTSTDSHAPTSHLYASVSHPALLHSHGTSTPDSVADGVEISAGGKQKDLQEALILIQASLNDYSNLAEIKADNEHLRKELQETKLQLETLRQINEQLKKENEQIKKENKNLHAKLLASEKQPSCS